MDGAFGWLGQFVAWVARFVPRLAIVNTTQGAVKFVRGWKVRVVGPGLHFYWPLVTEFLVFPTARQSTVLRPQSFMSLDGKPFAATALLVWEVEDLEPLVAHTYDPDTTVEELGQGAIHKVLCQRDAASLKGGAHHQRMQTALVKAVQGELAEFGVRVKRVCLVDLVPCRTIRLMQGAEGIGMTTK